MVYKTARLKDCGRNLTLTAVQGKLETGRLAVHCCEEAVQIRGGRDCIYEHPVCWFHWEANIPTIGEGTHEVQQMAIAQALGT